MISISKYKSKSILFETKCRLGNAGKPNITYQGKSMKQNFQVTSLVCILNETMSGETMTYSTIGSIFSLEKYIL